MSDNPIAGRKDAVVIAVSVTPDVCLLPNGVVACFDLTAVGTDAVNYCPTVRAKGAEVINLDTSLLQCVGDDAAASGIVSGTIKGAVEMLPNGCTVNSECQCTMRDGDPVLMNNKNTLGVLKVMETGVPPALSATTQFGNMRNQAEEADKDARKKKNQRPKNKGKNKKKFDKANAEYKKAKTKAAKLQVPGGNSKAGKMIGNVVKKVPGLDKAADVYAVGSEVLEGDACGVIVEGVGVGAGTASAAGGAWLCGYLGLAGGWPGLACAGVVIGGSMLISNEAKDATASALGSGSCPNPQSSSSPSNPTTGPGSTLSTPATPTPSPAPIPTPQPTVGPASPVTGPGSTMSPGPMPVPAPTPTPPPT